MPPYIWSILPGEIQRPQADVVAPLVERRHTYELSERTILRDVHLNFHSGRCSDVSNRGPSPVRYASEGNEFARRISRQISTSTRGDEGIVRRMVEKIFELHLTIGHCVLTIVNFSQILLEGGDCEEDDSAARSSKTSYGPNTVFSLNFDFSHKRTKFRVISAPVKEQVISAVSLPCTQTGGA